MEEAFTKWQTPTGGAIEPPAEGSATSGPEHRAPLTPDDLFRSVVIPKRVEPEAVGVSAHSAVRLELAQAETTLATAQAAATAEAKNVELAKAVRRALAA